MIIWGCSCTPVKGEGLGGPAQSVEIQSHFTINAYHSLQVDVIDVVGHNSLLSPSPKQHSIVLIHFGDGEACTGRGSCPTDGRGGPCS